MATPPPPPPPPAPPATVQQGFSPTAPLMALTPAAPDPSQGIGAGDAPIPTGTVPSALAETGPTLGGPYQAPVPVGVGAETTGAVEEDSRFM